MSARSKMVGVWETGEGERVPPPRRPLPPRRYPHGPAHGETPEKTRARRPTRYRHARTPPPPGGGGGAPQARVGWGMPARYTGILLRRRGWGGGCRQKGMGSLLAKARVGWGPPAEVYGYPLPQARAGWGMPAEAHGYPCEGATGAGEAGRSAWASSYRGAAGAGAAGRSVWISFAAGAGGVGAAGRKTPTPPVLPRRRAPPRPR